VLHPLGVRGGAGTLNRMGSGLENPQSERDGFAFASCKAESHVVVLAIALILEPFRLDVENVQAEVGNVCRC